MYSISADDNLAVYYFGCAGCGHTGFVEVSVTASRFECPSKCGAIYNHVSGKQGYELKVDPETIARELVYEPCND